MIEGCKLVELPALWHAIKAGVLVGAFGSLTKPNIIYFTANAFRDMHKALSK